jgi:hypothetical protein
MSTAAPEPPPALWLAASLFVHLAVAMLLLLGHGSWRTEVGERGPAGAGGPADEVEVTLLANEPEREAELTAPTEVAAEPVRESPSETEAPTRAGAPSTTEASAAASQTASATESASTTSEASSAPETASTNDTSTAAATTATTPHAVDDELEHGTDDSAETQAAALILGSAGRLSGESIRASALLGENLACEDPIAGTWVAYRYSPEFRDWARFTLRVVREGTSLDGTIVARMWRGLPSERRPPPCSADGWDYTVTMRATGNLIGDRMAFGATTHEVTRVDCASSFFSYNPDHFSGSVDPLADRMHTVNNDGGRDVNAPYEFHRTSCR